MSLKSADSSEKGMDDGFRHIPLFASETEITRSRLGTCFYLGLKAAVEGYTLAKEDLGLNSVGDRDHLVRVTQCCEDWRQSVRQNKRVWEDIAHYYIALQRHQREYVDPAGKHRRFNDVQDWRRALCKMANPPIPPAPEFATRIC